MVLSNIRPQIQLVKVLLKAERGSHPPVLLRESVS